MNASGQSYNAHSCRGLFKYLQAEPRSSRSRFSPITGECTLYGPRGECRIVALGKTVLIERPLWCAHDIFFFHDGKHWLITDDLAALISIYPKPEPDPAFIAHYLSSSVIITDRSPFSGIGCIMPGTIVTLRSDGQRDCRPLHDQEPPLDSDAIPETLTSCIASTCKANRPLLIELSGGLDSAGLFYSALALARDPARLHPVTYYDPNITESSDLAAASALCKKHGIPLQTIAFPPSGIVSSLSGMSGYKPARPSLWLLHCAPQQALLSCTHALPDDSIILNGHGGDHIFLADPTADAVIEHLWHRNPGFGQAFQTARSLTILMQRSWPGLLRECLANSMRRARPRLLDTPILSQPDADTSILTRDCHRLSLQEQRRTDRVVRMEPLSPDRIRRRRIIMAAVHHGAADRLTDARFQTIYPYLNRSLVCWAETRPDSLTFSHTFNRLPQRTSFHRRYRDTIFMRSGKGHISGALQRMIRAESDAIIDLVQNGEAVRLGFIKQEQFLREIRQCELGSEYVSPAMLLLLSLELYYRCWSCNP